MSPTFKTLLGLYYTLHLCGKYEKLRWSGLSPERRQVGSTRALTSIDCPLQYKSDLTEKCDVLSFRIITLATNHIIGCIVQTCHSVFDDDTTVMFTNATSGR